MRIFDFSNRLQNAHKQIPHVRAGVIHLIGPGRLQVRDGHLLFDSKAAGCIRIDSAGLEQVLAYGNLTLTTPAIFLCRQQGIHLSILDQYGQQVLGQFISDQSNRSLTRLLQLTAYNDSVWQLSMARHVVAAKINSASAAVRHYQRQGKNGNGELIHVFKEASQSAMTAQNVDELRGIEGAAAAKWYATLASWLPRRWDFSGRNRRPPKDPVNALLSLGYTQVYQRVTARLEASGYEGSLGALHEFRSGRMSLACDLMEPMRIVAVDRWIIAMIRQGICRPEHFEIRQHKYDRGGEGCFLKADYLEKTLARFESHWQRIRMPHVVDDAMNQLRISLKENVKDATGRVQKSLKYRVTKASS